MRAQPAGTVAMKNKKTARWVQRTHLFRADEYICSACGASVSKPSPGCPHCGRVMGRAKYDPTWVDEAEAVSALLDDDW